MKNNIKILMYASVVCLGIFNSCRKTEVDQPVFDIYPSKTTINAGETVNFQINGNPDILTFYSGEPDHDYQYNKRTKIDGGKSVLNFETTNAVLTSQVKGFTVLASTDFTGVNSTAAVTAASWTDITSQVNLASNATITASGSVDLNQFVSATEADKPLFIAFRYNVAAAAGQGTWVIKSFDVKNTTANRSFNITDISTAGWLATSFSNTALNWSITSIDLTITGRVNIPVATEDWVITKPLYLNRITPDAGLTIKDTSAKLSQFDHTFENAGVYVVTFVAVNSRKENQRQTIKQISITVN